MNTIANQTIRMRHIALFIFIILSWGLAWPINKIGLSYMSPLWYTAIRLIIGTGTMMAFVIGIKKFSLPHRRDIPLILIIGFLQISFYILLTNLGLAYLPAGRSSLLAYTTPLWVLPVAIFLFDEPVNLLKWCGLAFGLVGLILLLSPWEMQWSDPHILFGSAMLLLASLSWAISILCSRYMHWSKSPLELIPWQLLIGTVPVVIYAAIKEPSIHIAWSNTTLILSLLYTGFLVTGLSYWSGVVVGRELPSSVVSIGFLAVPVFSLITSAIFMHEAVDLTTSAAVALIMAGLVCVAL